MRSRSALAALPAALLTLAACGGDTYQALPPLKKIALPSGAALRPWDPAKPTRAAPQVMAAGPGGSAFISLTNLDAGYQPGGPGMLVRLQPNTGAQVIIPLGGADDRGCTNSGILKNEGGMLLAVCAGGYGSAQAGRAVVEVDPVANVLKRTQPAPAGVQPSAVAVASHKVWVGTSAPTQVYSLDKTSFAIADGADAAHPAIAVRCDTDAKPAAFAYLSDLLVVGGDLFALCGADDGYLVRMDSSTGALKGDKVLVGAQPVALALTGDGRIAVSNSVSGTLTLVTIGPSSLTVARDAITLGTTSGLQDLRARGNFLYTVTSFSNSVQKLDLAAKDPLKPVVSERPTGDNTGPYGILPLDDDQAIVTNNLTDEVAGINFKAGTSTSP